MLTRYRNGQAPQAVCELSGQSYGFASESFDVNALRATRSGPSSVDVCLANAILRIHIVRKLRAENIISACFAIKRR